MTFNLAATIGSGTKDGACADRDIAELSVVRDADGADRPRSAARGGACLAGAGADGADGGATADRGALFAIAAHPPADLVADADAARAAVRAAGVVVRPDLFGSAFGGAEREVIKVESSGEGRRVSMRRRS